MATNSNWTDEEKKEVIQEYKDRNPTPQNTMDIIKALAEEYDKSPNGVRMILTAAKEYIKKDNGSASKSSGSSENKPKRVSKQDAINKLVAVFEAQAVEPNMEIIDKMTGKAALYFAEAITEMLGEEEEGVED
jgi:transposase-like protein